MPLSPSGPISLRKSKRGKNEVFHSEAPLCPPTDDSQSADSSESADDTAVCTAPEGIADDADNSTAPETSTDKSEGISDKKGKHGEQLWKVKTTGLAALSVPALLGLYFSPTVQIAILAMGRMKPLTGRGEMITCNNQLRLQLAHTQDLIKALPLEETAAAAVHHIEDRRKVRIPVKTWNFVSEVLDECEKSGCIVSVCIHGDTSSMPSRIASSAAIKTDFQEMMDVVFDLVSDLPEILRSSLETIASSPRPCEPFIWRRVLDDATAQEKQQARLEQNGTEEERILRAYQELMSSDGMNTADDEFSYGVLSVVRGQDGKVRIRAISDPSTKQKASSYDYSSFAGIMNGINETEKNLIPFRNQVGNILLHDAAAADSVKKRSTDRRSRCQSGRPVGDR